MPRMMLVCLVCVVTVAVWALGSMEEPATRPVGRNASLADMGNAMVKMLRETEGCLGAESGRIEPAKVFIVAWFKDKQAVQRWYDHPYHKQMMKVSNMAPEEGRVPMEGVPEGVPIMAIATLDFSGPPAIEGSRIPFHGISIELYTPVSGGLRINSGFAPEALHELMEEPTTMPGR